MSKSVLRIFTKGFFVSVNIFIAIIFLLGCYASWFNPQQYWFVGLFTLASIYLLIVLIGFIVFWLFAKRIWMLVSIISIALAWKPIGQLVKIIPPPQFEIAKQKNALRIMSWNVEHFDILEHKKHPERKFEMLDLINKYEPDIACFQEMVGTEKDSSAINYIPAFQKYLGFKKYYFSYAARNDFDSKHSFGILIFSKYPMINTQTITNEKQNYNETFQYADILKNEDTIRVFNIHLQSLKFSKANLQYIKDAETEQDINLEASKNIISKFKTGFIKRASQSEKIKTEINRSPYPVIVCGDFNDVPNSYAYHTIGNNMHNAFSEKGFGVGRTFSGISPTLRIDNIFTDKVFNIVQYTCIQKKLSDHFPIICDIFLNKEIKK